MAYRPKAKKKSLLYGDWSNSIHKLPNHIIWSHMFKVNWIILGLQIILFFGSFVMANPWDGFALLLIMVGVVVQLIIYNIEW